MQLQKCRFSINISVNTFFSIILFFLSSERLRLTRKDRNRKSFIKKSLTKSLPDYFVLAWRVLFILILVNLVGFSLAANCTVAFDPWELIVSAISDARAVSLSLLAAVSNSLLETQSPISIL